MYKRVPTVLFIGTGNSSRSIMAEAILNEEFGHQFMGFSAGAAPKRNVHPIALDILNSMGYDTLYLRSKSWIEFGELAALRFDFAFTLCGDLLQKKYPIWNGSPITAHWDIPDPAAATGGEAEQYAAFQFAFRTIRQIIAQFANLPFAVLDRTDLNAKVREIGFRQSQFELRP